MRIAIFGGSFDPIHVAHVTVVEEALKKLNIDLLIVIPTYLNPFKSSFYLNPETRFELLKKVFKEFEKVQVCDYEINQQKISYSIDTVNYLKNLYNPSKIYLIIGEDNLKTLDKWHEIEKLKEGIVTPNMVLKDPYVLDFLELNDRYLEKDLEDAILRDIENFILELGAGFSFIARQKRVQIGNDDFYIDLLFYNRKLKRLIAIDLKLGKFKAEYKGQMELYLKYLEKHEKEDDENRPLGIILCSDKNEEQIELLELGESDIHIAKYLTVLPPKDKFEKRLHRAIENAKQKYKIKNYKEDELI